MYLGELEEKKYILSVKSGEGIGSEINAEDDDQALMLTGATIIACIKFLDEDNRNRGVESLRNLLDAYPEWSRDPEFDKPWIEDEEE